MIEPTEDRAEGLPPGIFPAMLTAFHENGAIDWDGVDRIADFCIESGVAGIFACGLSAEIDQMDDDEKAGLAEHIMRHVAGRVPVVAAAITGGPLQAQAELVRRVHAAGAELVAISVCQLADESEDDQVWIQRAEMLLKTVPADARLAFYECPLPYWRLLSEETFRWAAGAGRFGFLKDTCCDIERIRARLEILDNGPLRLYNANTETLLSSLRAGADGFCGIGANYFPELYGWLCKHFDDEPAKADELQHFLTTCVGLTEGECYPVSAKEYLRQRGLDIGLFSRRRPARLPPEIVKSLHDMRITAAGWTQRL